MTNTDILENKISAVKKYLKILEHYQSYSKNELEHDLNLRGALERYLYLAIQSTIDLAEGVIGFKSLRKPSTLAENFLILKEDGFISEALQSQMIKMTGFRNIITHDYADIDFNIAHEVLKQGLNDIKMFLKKLETL